MSSNAIPRAVADLKFNRQEVIMEFQDTPEAKIYQKMCERADELREWAKHNPSWEDEAWDAEETVAIYAQENESKIFIQ